MLTQPNAVSAPILFPSYYSIAAELVLNSINGGAKNITIQLDFILNQIRCKDNGKGIPKSKFITLFSTNNKINIISKISKVSIITRNKSDENLRIINDPNIQYTPLFSHGTDIIISKTFDNYPIRQKEITTQQNKEEEYKHFKYFINTLSLTNPNINFTIISDRTKGNITSSNNIEESWRKITGNYLRISSDETFTYYKNSIPINALPFTPFIVNDIPCIELTIDNKKIKPLNNTIIVTKGQIEEMFWKFEGLSISIKTISNINNNKNLEIVGNEEINNMKYIGIFDHKFILCHLNDVLYAIDQHAAHERVNLEKIINNLPNKFPSYELQLPMTLPNNLIDLITNDININLQKWGWKIMKTKNICYLYAIPYYDGIKIDTIDGLICYINQLSDGIYKEIPDCVMAVLQTKACKRAIKFGDVISDDEATELIAELAKCTRPNCCAHGRSVVVPIYNLKDRFVKFDHLY